MREEFEQYFKSVEQELSRIKLINEVNLAYTYLKESREKRIWLVGNGGSAATAMHFANDLQKMCHMDAVCLPTMVSTITAYGNDDGWQYMFQHAMDKFEVADLLIAISCSGVSPNIVQAAIHAHQKGGYVIVLTGKNTPRNTLSKLNYITIHVPSDDIKVVEDTHLVICHALVGALSNGKEES